MVCGNVAYQTPDIVKHQYVAVRGSSVRTTGYCVFGEFDISDLWSTVTLLGSMWYRVIVLAMSSGIILCMRPADERRRYNVTSSLIAWPHTHCNVVSHWLAAYTIPDRVILHGAMYNEIRFDYISSYYNSMYVVRKWNFRRLATCFNSFFLTNTLCCMHDMQVFIHHLRRQTDRKDLWELKWYFLIWRAIVGQQIQLTH